MSVDFQDFIDIKMFEELSKYSIEFGIFQEDGSKLVSIDILNPDESKSKYEASIADIMYLTDYGTITIPGKHILDKVLVFVDFKLASLLEEISIAILQNNINETEIYSKLQIFALEVENYAKTICISTITNTNIINDLLENGQKQAQIYDLNALSKYIKCMISSKN